MGHILMFNQAILINEIVVNLLPTNGHFKPTVKQYSLKRFSIRHLGTKYNE